MMEGNLERCQWLENSLYVDFGSTSDTDVQIWEAKAVKILDKIENLFSCRWQARIIGTLIESVYDQVYGAYGALRHK